MQGRDGHEANLGLGPKAKGITVVTAMKGLFSPALIHAQDVMVSLQKHSGKNMTSYDCHTEFAVSLGYGDIEEQIRLLSQQ